MANLENNNSENNKPISEKVGETISEVAEGVKHTLEHPLQSAEASLEQAKEDVKKFSWWAKLFLILVSIFSIIIIGLLIFVNLDWTRDRAASYVLGILNDDFKVQIEKEKVKVNIFGDVSIYGLKIKDFRNNDLIKAKKLRADSDWFSIITNSRHLKFSTLTLSEAEVKVVTYKGDSIDNFNRFITRFDNGKPRDPKKPPFQLNSRIIIENSKISIINQNHEGDEGKWLQAENVNVNIPFLKVVGPDVTARVNNFSFNTKRWGKVHQMKTFSTDFEITKEKLSLQDLTFETDHSLLQGNLVFNLDKETHWQDFTNKVNWDMDLKRGSQISGYDISYFATKWDNYKPISMSGKMNGTLNNFRLNEFLLKGKDVEIYTPATRFNDLLKGNFNIVSDKISANFTYPSLRAMVPSFVAKKMKNFADPFGKIKYNGAANVTPTKVIAKGTAITSIGQAIADITLSDINQVNPHYKGVLNVKDFNTAALTKNNKVGLISGKFNVDGRGFDVNTLELNTQSDISKIEITGKTINNLRLDGTLVRKQFNGIIHINDEEARGKIVGKIDFSTPKLFADIKGNIDYLNLNYFGVQGNGKSFFTGNVEGKIAFNSINDMNLDADLNNVIFYAGNQKISVPNGDVKAYFENGNRVVVINMPNVVKGTISGKYNLGDLSKMLQNGFDKILVGKSPKRIYKGQDFKYNFEVSQKLVNYFEPNLKIQEGAKINGFYIGNTNDLVLNADVSYLKYIMTKKEEISEADRLLAQANSDYKLDENKVTKDSAMINNVMVRINTANPSEQIFAKIDRIEYNKNILRDVTLFGNNENNKTLHLTANFKHGTPEDETNETLKSYALNLNQSLDENGDYVMKFEPTELKINNFTWNVDTSPELNHSITYQKNTKDFLIQNLRLYSDNSELFVNGVYKNAKDFNTDINVKNLDISKLLDVLPGDKKIDLKGIANGNVKIKMNQKNLEPIIDLNVNDIFLNNKNMGNMVVSAQNSDSPNIYNLNAKVVSSEIFGKNNLEVNGTINNNTKSPTLDLTADLKDFDLAFVQAFVTNIFSNFRGKATGLVKIDGTVNDINYGGDIQLNDFGLKVNFNGVDYSFEDTTVTLFNGRIILKDAINIKDGRNNSLGTLSIADIDLSNLSNIAAQVLVRSENLMLLNTEQKDFDIFWGKIYGKGALDIKFNDGVLAIDAGVDSKKNPSLQDETFQVLNNSVFTLNSNTTSSVDEFRMLRFLKEDKEGIVTIDQKSKNSVKMDINLLLSVDKGSTVNVLVGDEVGDISVSGNSEKLKFSMKQNGTMSLQGNYAVDNGTYVSKAILEKKFQIEKGSSISWDGDAFNPDLQITANYYRTVSNASDYLSLGKLPPINILLQTKISENLKKPKVDFGVSAPDVSAQVRESLALKMSNDDDRTRQFAAILLLNNFIISETGGFGNIDFNATVVDTGYNLALKQLGNVINNISEQFQIDIGYIKANPGSNDADRAKIGGNFVLSPRVALKTGLGIPVSKTDNIQSNYVSVDGILEYDVSKKNDGTLIIRAYSKPSNIGGNGLNATANQTYGAGVVYNKSFNSFFKKNKKPKDSLKKITPTKVDSIKKDSVK